MIDHLAIEYDPTDPDATIPDLKNLVAGLPDEATDIILTGFPNAAVSSSLEQIVASMRASAKSSNEIALLSAGLPDVARMTREDLSNRRSFLNINARPTHERYCEGNLPVWREPDTAMLMHQTAVASRLVDLFARLWPGRT